MDRMFRVPAAAMIAAILVSGVALPVQAELPLRTKKCGDVVMTSFRLRNNLVDCPGDGLVAGASGIIIDLNGKTISGPDFSAGADPAGNEINGVEVAALRGVVVRNGTIRDFSTAVNVYRSHRVTLRNLDVIGTRDQGLRIVGGRRHVVDDSEIVGAGGHGVWVWESNEVEITGNRIVNSADAGIFVNGYDARIIDNTVRANDRGIQAVGGEGYLASNRALRNRGDGIVVDGDLFMVTLGKAVDNRGDGYAFSGTGNTIHRVLSAHNDLHGIVGDGADGVVTRNTVCENVLRPQIAVDRDTTTLRNNTVSAECASGARSTPSGRGSGSARITIPS